MLMHVSCRILALVLFVAAFAPNPGLAAKATECTKILVCYCVNEDLKGLIDAKVVHFREVLASERKAGKAVGYMSVPLSTIGGGFFNANMEVAAAAKAHIEKRFGFRSGLDSQSRRTGSRTFRADPAPITCSCGHRFSRARKAWERISISCTSLGRRILPATSRSMVTLTC